MVRKNTERVEANRREVNSAAGMLFAETVSEPEYADALSVVNAWREAHIKPLITVLDHVQKSKKGIRYVAITPRVKRLPAITNKMQLQPTMKLTQMQDVVGCRAVVMQGIEDVKAMVSMCETVRPRRLSSRKIKKMDYIDKPRSTGYRGIHLIYQYLNHATYGDLKIEMQLRTWEQHAWATAVEAVGAYIGQDLKSGQGDERWLQFFRLMGNVLAIQEDTPSVEGIPSTSSDLYNSLRECSENLQVSACLQNIISMSEERERALEHAREFFNSMSATSSPYFLLELRLDSLTIRPYVNREEAWSDYINKETEIHNNAGAGDVVLVAAESLKDLRLNYTNYFADLKKFKSTLERALRTRLGPQFMPIKPYFRRPIDKVLR